MVQRSENAHPDGEARVKFTSTPGPQEGGGRLKANKRDIVPSVADAGALSPGATSRTGDASLLIPTIGLVSEGESEGEVVVASRASTLVTFVKSGSTLIMEQDGNGEKAGEQKSLSATVRIEGSDTGQIEKVDDQRTTTDVKGDNGANDVVVDNVLLEPANSQVVTQEPGEAPENVSPAIDEKLPYEWDYKEKMELTGDELLEEISDVLRSNAVLSVGEAHDKNEDPSFSWILDHQEEVFLLFNRYRQHIEQSDTKTPPRLEDILDPGSDLLARLENESPGMEELTQMHTDRFFAFKMIPLAAESGYKDLVVEGLEDKTPERLFEDSRSKIGILLSITQAMRHGMRVHGAAKLSLMDTPTLTANNIFAKTLEVILAGQKDKVLIHNGALHNMTVPYPKGTNFDYKQRKTDAHEWSYAPRALMYIGNRYGAIDLFNGNRKLGIEHFRRMQDEAEPGIITRYTHSIDQKTFIF